MFTPRGSLAIPHRRSLLWLAVLAACTLVFAACGSDDESENGGAASSSEAEVPKLKQEVESLKKPPSTVGTSEPLAEPPPKDKTIVALACNIPPCDLWLGETKEAGKALGWNVITVPFKPTPEEILNKMRHAVSLKPDGIVINGVPRAAFESALKSAEDIPVIQQDINDTAKPPVITVQNGTEEFELFGTALGKWAVADSNGKANAVLFTYANFPIGQAFINEAASTIKSLCKTCKAKVVVVQADTTGTTLPSRVVSEIQRDPKINYALFGAGGMTAGVPGALRAAGAGDRVKLAGAIPNSQALADLNSGTQEAYVNLPLGQQAWQAMDGFARHFTNAEQPTWSIPTQILVKGNFTGTSPVEPPDYQQRFKDLWKLG